MEEDELKEPNCKKAKVDSSWKELLFCLTPLAPRSLPGECSSFVQALDCSKAIVCLTPNSCNHTDAFVITWNKNNIPNVTMQDELCLLDLIHFNAIKPNTNVNFQTVLHLCDHLGVAISFNDEIVSFINEQEHFAFPIVALSAYQLTNKVQINPPNQCMYEFTIPYLQRLKYCFDHDIANEIFDPKPMSKQHVATQLNIEEELLDFLNPHDCVIAGGAALYLGCPQSIFPLCSDVDVYFFKKDNIPLFLDAIVKTGRLLFYDSYASKTIITAIGKYGVRRIQIILTTYQNGQELVSDFDLPPVRCFYDGTLLHPTIAALYAWETKKCFRRCFVPTSEKRLKIMQHKGFEVSPPFDFVVGAFNLQKEYLDLIPFISTDAPLAVQLALLHRYKYTEYNSKTELQALCFGSLQYHICAVEDVKIHFSCATINNRKEYHIVSFNHALRLHKVMLIKNVDKITVSPKCSAFHVLQDIIPKQLLPSSCKLDTTAIFQLQYNWNANYVNGIEDNGYVPTQVNATILLVPDRWEETSANVVCITYRIIAWFRNE